MNGGLIPLHSARSKARIDSEFVEVALDLGHNQLERLGIWLTSCSTGSACGTRLRQAHASSGSSRTNWYRSNPPISFTR